MRIGGLLTALLPVLAALLLYAARLKDDSPARSPPALRPPAPPDPPQPRAPSQASAPARAPPSRPAIPPPTSPPPPAPGPLPHPLAPAALPQWDSALCCGPQCPPAPSSAAGPPKAAAMTPAMCAAASNVTKHWKGRHGLCGPLRPPELTYALSDRLHARPPPPAAPGPAPATAPPHFRIADQALTYLEREARRVLDATAAEAVVVDYTWRATRPSRLPYALPPRWSFVTALLPDPVPDLQPSEEPLPVNQVPGPGPSLCCVPRGITTTVRILIICGNN